MLSNEQIAHDLALLGVQAAMGNKTKPLDENKNIIDDYLLRYKSALERLNKEFPQKDQS